MSELNGPRVFEEGVITYVVGADEFNLYVGTLRVKYIEKVEITTENEKSVVKIKFQRKNNKESMEIEENIRLVKTLSWIDVI